MSTRQKIPFAAILVVCALFALSTIPAFMHEPQDWSVREAEAGMRKNTSAQVVCAHLMGTSGADHTSGTVTVYYHPNATTQTSDGTASYAGGNGIWCKALSADATNADLVKIAWVSTGAVTVLQTYPTAGYDESGSYVPANVTHITGTAQTGGRVDANITHVTGTAQSGGYVSANLTHVNGTATTATLDSLAEDIAGVSAGTAVPTPYAPSAATRTVGDNDGGAYTDLAAHDDTYFSTGEVVGTGIDVLVEQTTSTTTDTPTTLRITGYYSGASTHQVDVYIYNYSLSAWEQKGVMKSRATPFEYTFALTADNHNAGDTGQMAVRFLHSTVSPYLASHALHLDYVSWEKYATVNPLAADLGTVLETVQRIEPKVDDIDAEVDALPATLSEEHGPGPWTK